MKTRYIYVNRKLDHFCIARKDKFIETFKEFCVDSSHFAYDSRTISKIEQYYWYAHIFLNEIQVRITSMLKSIHFQITTGVDLEMTSTFPMDAIQTEINHIYHVHMTSNKNKTIHIDILNNTFTKVHLYLDNSLMSAHIKDNVFTEAGITISSTSSNSHRPVILENNIFQENKTNTILELRDTTNVIISSSLFQNSQLSFQHIVDIVNYNYNSGMLCYNSHVEMHDSLFKNVSFFPVINFENCSFVSNNLTMIENDLRPFQPPSDGFERYSLVHMKHSEGVMESSKFESNVGLNCFWVTDGNITFVNMIAARNKAVRVVRSWTGTLSINNATIVDNTGSIFHTTYSVISISSCTFKRNSGLSTYSSHNNELLTFDTTDVTIADSVFEENNGGILISIQGPLNKSMITRSSFRFNRNHLVSVSFQWLQILSSIFESNDGHVMSVDRGYAVINGSMVNRNRNVLSMYEGSAEFTNCVFNSNYALNRGVAFSVTRGFIRLTNCSLWNNTASFDASVFLASSSRVVFLKCIAANNSASSDSTVISVTETAS